MHIPDGYLAPQTAIPLLVAAVPLLAVGVKKVGETVKKREVPVLAVGAAFSFVIMMFNLPIPGGSSAHAVGAVLLAFVGVSVALIIQALVFGDGGVMAIGANCINIALVMSFVGYYVYRMIRGNADSTSGRAVVAAFLAGYVALNAAAFITALEFGSQYHLFQAADGTPLYFMYPLKVAIAAMMSEHLLLAGPVEGIVTSLGMLFVSRNYPEMLSRNMIAGSKNWGVDSHV